MAQDVTLAVVVYLIATVDTIQTGILIAAAKIATTDVHPSPNPVHNRAIQLRRIQHIVQKSVPLVNIPFRVFSIRIYIDLLFALAGRAFGRSQEQQLKIET